MTVPSDTATAEIRLIDLEKRFGAVRAVDGVSLDVQPGEFFSLLGPSGCGKTTTLRMIGGFELPTGGRILLRDREITMDPPDKRPVNMVFQNYALFPHLDVGDNVAFGLKRRSVAKPEIARRVGAALELVHLTGYERQAIYQGLKDEAAGSAFNAEVGDVLPVQVVLRPVPAPVAARVPQTKEYQYAVAGDRVLLVSPANRIVVGVFRANPEPSASVGQRPR